MAIGIRTNEAALAAQNVLRLNALFLLTKSSQLSSGKRLVSAAVDPSGVSLDQQFRSRIGGTDVAVQNAQDAVSLARTAEGALGSISDVLNRNRELAVRASNSATLSDQQRAILNQEFQANNATIDQIAQGSTFNTKPLNEGSYGTQPAQVGPDANQNINVTLQNATSAALGVAGQDLTTTAGAQAAITAVDDAVYSLSNQRADIGITERRLESSVRTLNNDRIQQAAAKSRIADVDYAKTITEFTQAQIKNRFGISALAAANANPLSALNLLTGFA